jgi:cyclohexanecarboxylate-CoA ligase
VSRLPLGRLAAGLRDAGVERGDIVAWQSPNRSEVLDLYRACWHLGAVAAPLHHRFTPAEVSGLVERLSPRVFFDGLDALPDADPIEPVSLEDDDLAVVLFTSGTSGPPKGVLHNHGALRGKARDMVRAHGLTADDVVLMPAPLAHISGLLNGLLVPEAAGMQTVLMDRWVPEDALDLIATHGVTFMVGPPTFFVSLMGSPAFSSDAVASLRMVSSGGAGVTPAFVRDASARLGAVVKRTYGSTEAPSITTSMVGDDPTRAADTDGRVVGEAELKLVAGELWVRGPELFVGYLGEPRREGWFHTGDLATIDNGWLTITGRLKDVIIRAGENISMSEVEAVLEAHPDVRAAAVVGELDDRLGERVVAFVVGDLDLESCQAWFADQAIARFKTPERVVVVDTLPTLPSGKIDRAALLG